MTEFRNKLKIEENNSNNPATMRCIATNNPELNIISCLFSTGRGHDIRRIFMDEAQIRELISFLQEVVDQ